MSAIRSLAVILVVSACARPPADLAPPTPSSLHAAAADERGVVRVALFHPARLLVVQLRDQIQVVEADTVTERHPGVTRVALPSPIAVGTATAAPPTDCTVKSEMVGTDSIPSERMVGTCSSPTGSSPQARQRVWVLVVATDCPLSGERVAGLAGLRASPADLESTVLRGMDARRAGCHTETTLALR